MHRASAVIAHSECARETLIETYEFDPARCHVIPHGDLSVALNPPIPAPEAQSRLGIPARRLCLIFGSVSPYKGIEEVLRFWRASSPDATLAIVGDPVSPEYRNLISREADHPNILTRLDRVDDAELALWLSAADCAIFNYRSVFTSGGACLARSFGVPILIPKRLRTVDLDEPHLLVHRFDTLEGNFSAKLDAALANPPSFAAAGRWREQTAWDVVAARTASVYRNCLRSAGGRNSTC